MKVVSDLSVTSVQNWSEQAAGPWNSAWLSPLSNAEPGLVLDFAAGLYGSGTSQNSIANLLNLNRPSAASYYGATGNIDTAAIDEPRLSHDPVSLARLGLLLEPSSENLVVDSDSPVAQDISVSATDYVISFYGTGTVTCAGAFTTTIAGSGIYPDRTVLALTPSAGTLSLSFAGDVSYLQVEAGNVASTYVATSGAPVTRADDIATVPLGTWFDTNEGTIVFSGHLDGAEANDRIFQFDAGASSTRLSLLWNTVLGKPQLQVWDGGALQAAIAPPGNAIGLGTPFRVAVSYADDDFVVSLNGSNVASDLSGSVPSGLMNLRIGRSVWGAQCHMMAESLIYYPTRLSNAEVQLLSS